MAVVKRVLSAVQEWLEESNHQGQLEQECNIEALKIKAIQLRQFIF